MKKGILDRSLMSALMNLGEEGGQHHQILLGLENSVTDTTCSIGRWENGQQQPVKKLQDVLTGMRDHIRELELLADEQDT